MYLINIRPHYGVFVNESDLTLDPVHIYYAMSQVAWQQLARNPGLVGPLARY